ncbi:class I SAM-dependent methyltransferase [Thermogladius sp. 4427co]|uniref:class I SAM-dependent methyltransferase n=1 Tax=Thermogladius sp. 4427co TaxID=3450718 RepID=UPI003F7A2D01
MPICLAIKKELAETVIRNLRKLGLIDSSLQITRDERFVFIPIKTTTNIGLETIIPEAGYEIVECNPPSIQRARPESIPPYDLIGDIAIVRSRVTEFMDANSIIEALRSIHPRLRSIYIITRTEGEFRTPMLEHLWGEKVDCVLTKEYGLLFKVCLGKVYYNPRLAEEHHRLAESVGEGEIVLDMFSGVGGFAIHIASLKNAIVYANDKNPAAFNHIVYNIILNKKKLKGIIIPLNRDAYELNNVFTECLFDRIIANLPTRSLEFLDVYRSLLCEQGRLHIYVLSYDIESTLDTLRENMRDFNITGYKLVLEHSPRAGIFRIDLVKSNSV